MESGRTGIGFRSVGIVYVKLKDEFGCGDGEGVDTVDFRSRRVCVCVEERDRKKFTLSAQNLERLEAVVMFI